MKYPFTELFIVSSNGAKPPGSAQYDPSLEKDPGTPPHNHAQEGVAIKILAFDLAPVVEELADRILNGGKAYFSKSFARGPEYGLYPELIKELGERGELLEDLFLNHTITAFASGETPEISLDESVTGKTVFLMPTFRKSQHANQAMRDLSNSFLLNLYSSLLPYARNALLGAHAKEVHALLPFSPNNRSDQHFFGKAGDIMAATMAEICKEGLSSVTSVQLHSAQTAGFWHGVPFFHVRGHEVFVMDFLTTNPDNPHEKLGFHQLTQEHFEKLFSTSLIGSPDVGGAKPATQFATYAKKVAANILAYQAFFETGTYGDKEKILDSLPDIEISIADKRRGSANHSRFKGFLESTPATGMNVFIYDDISDTFRTIKNAAQAFVADGAKWISAYVAHPVLSGDAAEQVDESPLEEVVGTDGLSTLDGKTPHMKKFRRVSSAPAVAQVIIDISTKPKPSYIPHTRYVDDPAHLRETGSRYVPAFARGIIPLPEPR